MVNHFTGFQHREKLDIFVILGDGGGCVFTDQTTENSRLPIGRIEPFVSSNFTDLLVVLIIKKTIGPAVFLHRKGGAGKVQIAVTIELDRLLIAADCLPVLVIHVLHEDTLGDTAVLVGGNGYLH